MSSNTSLSQLWERQNEEKGRPYPDRRHFGNGVLGDITEPTDDQKRRYYCGLAGLPRLIARTSTDKWDGSNTTGRDPKTVSIIGNHPIVQKWCPELRSKIINVLNETLDWEVFYTIRVGREQDSLNTYPVVLMIGLRNDGPKLPEWRDIYARETERGGFFILLEPRTDAEIEVETNGWLGALRAALRCRQLLRDYDIEDVEVEVFQHKNRLLGSSVKRTDTSIAESTESGSDDVSSTPLSPPLTFGSLASRDFSRQMDWSFSRAASYFEKPTHRDLTLAQISDTVMPLLPYPGGCIEQEPFLPGKDSGATGEADTKTGTLGLYLRLQSAADNTRPGSGPGSVYALTSRHVAIACRAASDKDISQPQNDSQSNEHSEDHNDGANNTALRIYSAGARSRKSCLCSLKSTRYRLEDYSRDFESRWMEFSEDEEIAAQLAAHNDALAYCAKLQAAIQQMHGQDQNQDQGQDQNQNENLADRYLGTVAYSPCHRIDAHGHFSDWALVRLNDNGGGSSYENKVYLAGKSTRKALHEADFVCEKRWRYRGNRFNLRYQKDLTLDHDGFIHLHTRDLPAQPFFALEPEQRAPHLVAKRGAETGLRFGQTNELEAVFRTPSKDSPSGYNISYSLMVLGFLGEERRSAGNLNFRFAEPRDAGACVFDTDGRIVGIVEPEMYAKDVYRDFDKVRTAGTRVDPCCSDFTFVTPIQWILEDIKQFTGMEPALE